MRPWHGIETRQVAEGALLLARVSAHLILWALLGKSGASGGHTACRRYGRTLGPPRGAMRMRRHQLLACALVAGSLTSGCVTHTRIPYPITWPAPQPATADCPRLEGRYDNEGALAPGNDDSLCRHEKGRWRLSWLCDVALARNIADSESGHWVELRQPDADTLIVVSSDPRVDVKTLHRSSGDFSCGPEGLRRRQHANTLSQGGDQAHSPTGVSVISGISSTLYAMFASGGIRTLTRSFNPALDGSLVMSVTINENELAFALPSHTEKATYVRWQRVSLDQIWPARPAPGSSLEDAVSPVARPAPSEQFARFQPRRQFVSSAYLSAVDGLPQASADLSTIYPPPQAFLPGRHWAEIGVHVGNIVLFRDLYATYGFVLDAMTGHTYSLAAQPGACERTDKEHTTDAPSMIFRKKLTVIDGVMGREVGRRVVNALCTSSKVTRCKSNDPPPSGIAGGSCITPEGAESGFWGVEAGGH
jgi:hypothetical protein